MHASRELLSDAPTTSKTPKFALLIALLLVIGACGGAETSVDESGSEDDEAVATDVTGATDVADPDVSTEEASYFAEVLSVDLPDGVEVFIGDSYTSSFGEAAYMVSPRTDGVRLVVFDAEGARDTDAAIAGAAVAKVFNSGSHVVITGGDGDANLVILASEDGANFTETLIPIPARYVEGNVWSGTNLVGDVLGVADLDGELFVIARIGLNWAFPRDLVARYGYTISEEVGDAATSAGVISAAPQGDGDTLYSFKKDGEVVLEVLGSEAGLEAGYEEAYEAFYSQENADAGFTGAWIISGGTAVQASNPPLNGELDEDLRLHQLYSVGEGVVAIVTDFSPDAAASQRYVAAGSVGFSSASAAFSGFYSEWSYGAQHSWDGDVWETVGDPIGDPTVAPPRIFVEAKYNTFGWFQTYEDMFVIDLSDDGVTWETPEWTIDLTLPGGSKVEIQMIDGEIIQLFHPTTEDGDYQAFKVTLDDDGGDAFVEEIDVETGKVLEWDGHVQDSVFRELEGGGFLPDTTGKVSVLVIEKRYDVNAEPLSAIFFGDGLEDPLR